MEIETSENVRPGGAYSTVFQANKETYGLNNPEDKRFSFGLIARTELVMTGFYSRAGKQLRVEWSVAGSRGADIPIVDTPQVYEAINEISKRIEAANAGLSLSGLTTWLLTENAELPEGLGEKAGKAVDKLTDPFKGLTKFLKTGGYAMIGVLGIVAVGLAVGLSKSRANV